MAAQGEPQKNVTVRFPTPWLEALDRKAAELGVTRSDLIRASVPVEEQLVTKADVPRGQANDKKENLVGKDMGRQSAAIAGHDVNKNNVVFPRSNRTE